MGYSPIWNRQTTYISLAIGVMAANITNQHRFEIIDATASNMFKTVKHRVDFIWQVIYNCDGARKELATLMKIKYDGDISKKSFNTLKHHQPQFRSIGAPTS